MFYNFVYYVRILFYISTIEIFEFISPVSIFLKFIINYLNTIHYEF
jgi:hypothetical protein